MSIQCQESEHIGLFSIYLGLSTCIKAEPHIYQYIWFLHTESFEDIIQKFSNFWNIYKCDKDSYKTNTMSNHSNLYCEYRTGTLKGVWLMHVD